MDKSDVQKLREWALGYLEMPEGWGMGYVRLAAEFIAEKTKTELPEHMLGMKVRSISYGEGVVICDRPVDTDYIDASFPSDDGETGAEIKRVAINSVQFIDWDPNRLTTVEQCELAPAGTIVDYRSNEIWIKNQRGLWRSTNNGSRTSAEMSIMDCEVVRWGR